MTTKAPKSAESHQEHHARLPCIRDRRRRERRNDERDPEVAVRVREMESLRQHADHVVRTPVEVRVVCGRGRDPTLSGCPPSVAVQHSGLGGEDLLPLLTQLALRSDVRVERHRPDARGTVRPPTCRGGPSSPTTRCGPRPGTSILPNCAACTDSGPSRAARRVSSGTGSAKKRHGRSRTRTWCAGSSRPVGRHTRTILPATTTTERICADALVDAERRVEARIAERVPPGLRRGPRASARRDGRRPA